MSRPLRFTALIFVAALSVGTPAAVFAQDDADSGEEEEAGDWEIYFGGYVRAQYTAIEDDPDFEQYGRHDGFQISDARLEFSGEYDETVGFDVSVDAGTLRPSEQAQAAGGEMATRLKDGFLYYKVHPQLRASAGQFKVPFQLEDLISTSDMLFVERSVGNRGVRDIEGPNREGLTQDRQVGLRLDSKPYFFGDDEEEAFGLSYALAATNGVAANEAFNDNDRLAYAGRLDGHWGERLRVGAAAFYNDRTLGDPPDQVGEERLGFTSDVLVKMYGVTLLGSATQVDISPSPEIEAEQDRTARSYQAQIAYEVPDIGIQPAYRFANYDPATDQEVEGNVRAYEALTYHTFGLNYNSPDYPVRVMLNYTLTGEAESDIDNDRLDALVQLSW
ncbi:MAG: porin [Persicimonas sp.]